MRPFYFSGTRRPDFRNIPDNIYRTYWGAEEVKLRSKLLEREKIFFEWITPESRILSIGCGNSRLLSDLKKEKACSAVGIDIAPNVVAAQKNAGVTAHVADVSAESFGDDLDRESLYDFIIVSEVLEHLVLPERLIRKIKDKSRYIIASVPNSAFYRYRLGLMFIGRFPTQWARHPAEHLRYWSHRDFCSIL